METRLLVAYALLALLVAIIGAAILYGTRERRAERRSHRRAVRWRRREARLRSEGSA